MSAKQDELNDKSVSGSIDSLGVTPQATAPPLEAFVGSGEDQGLPPEDQVMQPPVPGQGALGVHEMYVRSLIRQAPGWPTPSVTFLDLSPLLADVRALRFCIDSLASRYATAGVTHIAGVDARGFTFGCARM